MNYCPDTCVDPSFCGIDEGAPRCRGHGMEPRRSVAFEVTSTGRRSFECCIRDHVDNCSFVSWVDAEEWPDAFKNSLRRLWTMYHECSDKRIEERLENAELVQELVQERDKFKKNYYNLMEDVEKLMKDQEIIGSSENAKKVNDEKDAIFDMDRRGLEAEVVKLNSELFDLKEEKKQWQKKEEAWKEEKKHLEYNLFKLFKVNNGNKEKLLKIKEVVGNI